MKSQKFKEKIKKINRIQLALNLLVLIIFVILIGIFFSFVNAQSGDIQEVQMAIHAVEQADYSDDFIDNDFPGVKLSILWEILYDQNISQEELEARMQKLEERLNNPVPMISDTAPESEIPELEKTPVVVATTSAPGINVPTTNPSQATISLLGPNPFITPTITPSNQPGRTMTATKTPVLTITKSVTNPGTTGTITPSISPTRSSTSILLPTGTPSRTPTSTYTWIPPTLTPVPPTRTFTSTNTIIPTLTLTLTRTNTPTSTNTRTSTPTLTFTPTRTNTPTNTFTWTPTQTYTFTPIPPTFTPTWTNTPTPTDTLTPTQTFTFTPIPPTFTSTPLPSPTATIADCNASGTDIPLLKYFIPTDGSSGISVNIQPVIIFDQSIDPISLQYGDTKNIVLCIKTSPDSNACNSSEIVPASVEVLSTVYRNDFVIIHPISPIKNNQRYTIFLGNNLKPHPECSIYSLPISTRIQSSFTTIE